MNGQSLILDGPAIHYLRLDDVSLRVKGRQSAEQRIPLRCLLRVHCFRDPAEGFDTLLMLAERHIPVTFFDRTGRVRGQLYHPQPEPTALALWLEHCYGESPFQTRLDAWLEAQQLALFATLDIHQGPLVERHAFLMAELAHFQRAHPERMDDLISARERLSGLLDAYLSEMLLAHGLPPGGVARGRLYRDLKELLEFWLDGQAHRWLSRLPAPDSGKDVWRLFNAYAGDELSRRIALLLRQLQGFVEAYALEQVPAGSGAA